jgi:hypothetical protein
VLSRFSTQNAFHENEKSSSLAVLSHAIPRVRARNSTLLSTDPRHPYRTNIIYRPTDIGFEYTKKHACT